MPERKRGSERGDGGGKQSRENKYLQMILTLVELHGCGTFKGKSHAGECICQTLNSDADWAVTEVGILGFNDWIEVYIDDFVQILRHHFSDLVQSLEIVRAVHLINECG